MVFETKFQSEKAKLEIEKFELDKNYFIIHQLIVNDILLTRNQLITLFIKTGEALQNDLKVDELPDLFDKLKSHSQNIK